MPRELPEFDRPSIADALRAEEPYVCDAFERRLHEVLDERRLAEDDSWLQAAASRASEQDQGEYRQLLVGQQLMLDGLEMSEIPELPAGFAQRCVASIVDRQPKVSPASTSQSSRASAWRYVSYAAITVAVALLVAVPLWMIGNGEQAARQGDQPSNPAVVPEIDPAPEVPVIPEPARPNETPEDAFPRDDSIDRLADDPDRRFDELWEAFRGFRERIPPAGDDELFALVVHDMNSGLQPVANSVGDAISVLRRNLPPAPRAEGEGKPQARLHRRLPTLLVG